MRRVSFLFLMEHQIWPLLFMNKTKLYLVISLMSLALLGIVLIQVSLLKRSLKANEENFAAGVNDALHETVSLLEARRMKTHFVNLKERIHVVRSTNGTILEERVTGRSIMPDIQTVTDIEERINVFEIQDSMALTIETDSSMEESSATVIWMSGVTGGLEEDQNIRIELQGDPDYVKMMQSTLKKLDGTDQGETTQIDSLFLHQVLKRNLQDQGIDLHYSVSIGENSFSFSPDDKNPESDFYPEVNTHQIALYPNAHMTNHQTLSLIFPNQSSFLLKSIWREAVGSLLFSGIILFCFGLTIKTIFRQKRLSEMKNDFINNMTHELKTPIATIGLAAETLSRQKETFDPEFLARYTGIIREENSRINRQVERVLQAAQFDRNEIQLDLQSVALNEILDQAISHFQLQVENRGGRITSLLDGNPQLRGDSQHLANVVSNLLDNANKYSPDTPMISIETILSNNKVKILVSDQGKGIPKANQAEIFNRFFRVSTGDLHEVKGFGLGLSYVKEVVEAHQGSILVESKVDQGSTFIIELPLDNGS